MVSQLKMGFSRDQGPVRTQTKPPKPRPRQQQQGHFDPEELTRRLYIVLADQKAQAERKKAVRAGERAKLTEPRPWHFRSAKDAPEKSSKGATRDNPAREAVTGQSSQQTSLKPMGSTSSREVKRQKSLKLSAAAKKESKEAPKKAPNAEPAPATYHHVPQEAAKQFQRTTTVDTMRENNTSTDLAHKLSKQALKLHLAAGAAAHHPSSLRPAIIEEQPVSPVEKLLKDRERVDQWRSAIPDEQPPVLETEEEKEEYHTAPQYQQQQQQHSFRAELARLKPHAHPPDQQHRRNSTGDILVGKAPEDNRLSMVLMERTSLADVLEEGCVPEESEVAANPDEHRVDWTQSDEQRAAAAAAATVAAGTNAAHPSAAPRGKGFAPLLRKADSIWTLRGRLGSGSKGSAAAAIQEKCDMAPISESPSRSPKSPKSPREAKSPREPKGGFFAKFKR